METLPFELLVVIAECVDSDKDINNLAATNSTFLAAVKSATWRLQNVFIDPYMSSYGISYTAEYRYLNRFTVAKILEINGQRCECEYTPFSNSISKLTSLDINFVSHTPNHGITYFELFKILIMLRKGLRFAVVMNKDQQSDEILRIGDPTAEYNDESGLMIIDYLTGVVSEIYKAEKDAKIGDMPIDDRMLNCLSEYFRTMIFAYTNYMHKVNGDAAFMQTMEALFRSLTRERFELPGITREDEDRVILTTPAMINAQLCEYLKSFKYAFKFESKITISDNSPVSGIYFYQFEKLQSGYYISRITKLD